MSSEYIDNFYGLDDEHKFICLLKTENNHLLSCVANYLSNSN